MAIRFTPTNAIEAEIGAAFADQLNLLQNAPSDVGLVRADQIATVERVDGADEVRLPWLGYVPSARRFEGERQFYPLQAGTFSIPIQKYEASLSLPREALLSHLRGGMEAKIRDLANELVRYKARLAVNVLATGTSLKAFDGEELLKTSRGNLTSAPLSLQAVQDGMAAMGAFTSPYGQPLNRRATHLLVGPKLEFVARQIVQSQSIVIAGSTTAQVGAANPVYNTVQLLVSPDLVGPYDDYWFLLDLSGIRPVVVVEDNQKPDELIVRSDPQTSDIVFARDEVQVGILSYAGFGPGAWYAVYAGIL